MRRWIRLASYLYPAGWRARYGVEFEALLDDAGSGWRELADVLRGAFIMQMGSWKSYGKAAVAAGIVCALVALGASYLIPNRYESSAMMRLIAPMAAGAAANASEPQERLVQMQTEILGRRTLEAVIMKPALNLYPEDRKRFPIATVAENMRLHDIHIKLYQPPSKKAGTQAFAISFDYPDPEKARQVLRELCGLFMEWNFSLAWKDGSAPHIPIELVQPPNLPQRPMVPNHLAFLWMGLGAGVLLGLVATLVWRRPKWTLQIVAFAAAGFVVALAVSFLIPSVYVSRAVLRIAETPDGTPTGDRLQSVEQQVHSSENLARLIQLPNLDLYPKQRAQRPISDVVEAMRSKDLRIHAYPTPLSSHTQAFEIRFSYPDPIQARALVDSLTGQFIASSSGAITMLEPADLAQIPAFPNRRFIAIPGGCAGLLIGLVTLRWRGRPEPAPVRVAA